MTVNAVRWRLRVSGSVATPSAVRADSVLGFSLVQKADSEGEGIAEQVWKQYGKSWIELHVDEHDNQVSRGLDHSSSAGL